MRTASNYLVPDGLPAHIWRSLAPAERLYLTELPNYYGPARESAAAVLRYLATMDMTHWHEDAEAAKLVAGAVENDHV